MNRRQPLLTVLFFTVLTLPLCLRADDTSASSPTTTAAPATVAPAPMAQPPIVAPSATAAGDTTPTAPASPQGATPSTYTMVAGDTLDSVAKKFGTSIHALVKLNHISKSQFRKLRPGKVLQIPQATTDTTATGSTK